MNSQHVNIVIKILVIFHLAAITIWSLPDPRKEVMEEKIFRDPQGHLVKAEPTGTDWLLYWNWKYLKTSPIKYYLMSSGVWQYWDMFAPNPSNWDGYVDAVVTYKDGTEKQYQYPRMRKLGIVERYFKERYRKFLERAHTDQYSWMWPFFAQRIAMEACTDKNNPPVQVKLRRHWREIQPPDQPQPKEYNTYQYYVHDVDQDKLMHDLSSPWAH